MSVRVIILAGQREGVVDPLCKAAGVARKALLPIAGTAMIDYVIAALKKSGLEPPYGCSGFDASHSPDLIQMPSAAGPANSAMLALESLDRYPVVITTCDHPLLTASMIEHFIEGARAAQADFCVGLADKTVIQPAYPDVKRTYLKFSDKSVSGCNLFYIANSKGLAAIKFWQTAQQYRKQPWKLARAFSLPLLLRYISGRLGLKDAFAHASKTLGIVAAPVMLPFAEAAIDVDKPSDKELVESIIARGYPKQVIT